MPVWERRPLRACAGQADAVGLCGRVGRMQRACVGGAAPACLCGRGGPCVPVWKGRPLRACVGGVAPACLCGRGCVPGKYAC